MMDATPASRTPAIQVYSPMSAKEGERRERRWGEEGKCGRSKNGYETRRASTAKGTRTTVRTGPSDAMVHSHVMLRTVQYPFRLFAISSYVRCRCPFSCCVHPVI